MVYLLKNLNFKKYSLKFNKEKKILNQNLFTTKLKNFYEINNKKLIDHFRKNNNGLELAKKRSFLLDQIIYKCYFYP